MLLWEASFATEYIIQGSQDGEVWNTITTESNGDGETDVLDFNPTPMRYIKIIGTKRAHGKWGYSLYEVNAYQE